MNVCLRRAGRVALLVLLALVPDARAQTGPGRPDASTLPSPAVREAPSLRFERIGLEDGLAQRSVYTVFQDRQGFLWFGTQAGLHRYDGHTMEVFAPTPFDTTSLSSGNINAIAEAAGGGLWVATFGGGLNRLDPATGRAVHYRHDPADSTSLADDTVRDVLETASGDVWVATEGEGLSRMRAGEEGRFETLRHDPADSTSITSDYVFDLSEDAEGFVWASSANGVNRIEPATGRVERFLYAPDAEGVSAGLRHGIRGHYHAPETPGVVWLASARGLVRLDAETGAHERFLVEPDPDPRNRLLGLTADPNDPTVLWAVGPAVGLARFDTRTETFTTYRNDPRDPHSLSDDGASAILADRSGTMWVGTQMGGVNAFNPKSTDFVHLRHDPDDAGSLAPGSVHGLYEDRTGSLWAATAENAEEAYVTRFDAETGRVTRYRHDPNDPTSIQPGEVLRFAEDPSGALWMSHLYPGGGLSRIDPATGRVTRYGHPRTPENVRRNHVVALLPARSDSSVFWIGTADGLERLDTRTGTLERVELELNGLVEEPVYIIPRYEDAEGTLWAYVDGRGLMRIRDGELQLASAYDPQDPTSISHNMVSDIHVRDEEPHVLWVATMNGLNRFDTRTGTATHYFEEDGLPNHVIYAILEDEAGTLWMSTNAGISNFDPETETFRNYGLDDGLMALEYNDAWAEGAGGVLYFGSGEGVTAFSPEDLTTNDAPPPVALTGFRLFNEPVRVGAGSLLERSLAETERITLAHDQNEVAFEFVALHFGNPAKNRYAYRLEGYDADWVEADAAHRTASYTNLPPGDYTFRVRAANPDGVWNEQGAAVGLTIRPPWWRTPWAYALFAVLFAAGVFAVDRVQRRRLASKERERAQIREAELRAEAQARRRQDAERLAEIGRAITSTLAAGEVIERVYEHVNAFMDAAVFGIGIHNPDRARLDFPATKERGVMLKPYAYGLDDPRRLAVWCFRHQQPVVIGHLPSEGGRYLEGDAPAVAGDDAVSIIYLPLVHQGRTIGVITVQSFERDAYADYHVSVLETLATYAAIALDNAEAYRRLRATQQQLVQQEKLASLGQLTAGIAHEIKNPLNFINNFAELIRELTDELREAAAGGDLGEIGALADDLRVNAAKIEEHGRRADGIVRSMMAHARSGRGERQRVDVNQLVDEHVELAYHGKRAQTPGFAVEVERDYDADAGTLDLVPQDVGRVVLNLVSNAFDALEEHAAHRNGTYVPTVRVSTRRTENGPGEGVELRVADNGPGIPEAVRARIFEPFFTTKPTGKGTGLGLSMSHDIVAQGHGGTLTVETAEGGGTTFVITLPDVRPAPAAPPPA